MRNPIRLLLAACLASRVSSFSIVDSVHMMQTASDTLTHQLPQVDILDKYNQLLQEHTLPTQMVTGATLAAAGDAIAQSQDPAPYDKKRAGSFMVFDMLYRVLQHYAFPAIVVACQGQYFGSIPFLHDNVDVYSLATVERTLASQLGIVPFLYYPCFFAMTGFVQGLSVDATVTRAKETFLFLMSRNLMFWLPVQYYQFGFVEEQLQIPFSCAAGLVWTTILSLLAGSTKGYSTPEEEVGVAMEEIYAAEALSASPTPVKAGANSTLVEV